MSWLLLLQSRGGITAATLCLLLVGFGKVGEAVASFLDEEILWIGDDWCTSNPCPAGAYILETGHPVLQFPDDKQMLEMNQNFVDYHLCCINQNDTQYEEQCYSIVDRYAPYRDTESDLATFPSVFGQRFHMRCPLESTILGVQYHWRRYTTIDQETRIDIPADVEFSENGKEWWVEALSAAHNGMYECLAVNKRGERVFSNTAYYFISTSGCTYHAPVITITTNSSGVARYRIGDRVVLDCTALAVDGHEQPFWYQDSRGNTSVFPTYPPQNDFDESACRWRSKLVIHHFSEETAGTYHCTVGGYGANVTLEIEEHVENHSKYTGSEDTQWLNVDLTEYTAVFIILVVVPYWWCYQKRRSYKHTSTEEPPYDGFMYDAFISAHDEVRDFVQENLLPSLESSSYHLCWHSRDFIPGVPIMEQISQTMAKSRKIIFVFSEHFSQSKFCSAELELAMSRYMSSCTRCILPLTLTSSCVPRNLKQLITYLPLITLQEDDITGKIAKVMGRPIPVVIDRLNDSLIEE